MEVLFMEYPKCSYCRSAKKWLNMNNIYYKDRHIVERPPTEEEIERWIKKSGISVNNFFNKRGDLYRRMKLKKIIPALTEKEKIKILSSNGMLIKRPILETDNDVLIGFEEEQWGEKLLTNEQIKKGELIKSIQKDKEMLLQNIEEYKEKLLHNIQNDTEALINNIQEWEEKTLNNIKEYKEDLISKLEKDEEKMKKTAQEKNK